MLSSCSALSPVISKNDKEGNNNNKLVKSAFSDISLKDSSSSNSGKNSILDEQY